MVTFPTNKAHVSFSEVKAWAEWPFRHHLMYVKNINTYVDNPYADFGIVVHDAIAARPRARHDIAPSDGRPGRADRTGGLEFIVRHFQYQ